MCVRAAVLKHINVILCTSVPLCTRYNRSSARELRAHTTRTRKTLKLFKCIPTEHSAASRHTYTRLVRADDTVSLACALAGRASVCVSMCLHAPYFCCCCASLLASACRPGVVVVAASLLSSPGTGGTGVRKLCSFHNFNNKVNWQTKWIMCVRCVDA